MRRKYDGKIEELRASLFYTSFGKCSAIFNPSGELLSFYLPTSKKKAEGYIEGILVKESKLFENIIQDYFFGKPVSFESIKIYLADQTEFRQKVYKALRGVGRGKTVSYGELASLAGSPNAGRAVGSAMANNPIPLIIPCHRVIEANGDLGSFSSDGGVDLKRQMLELESAL